MLCKIIYSSICSETKRSLLFWKSFGVIKKARHFPPPPPLFTQLFILIYAIKQGL